MKTSENGRVVFEDSVWANRTGYRFDTISLDAKDFAALSRLSPEALREWLTHWQCGFFPKGAT